MFKGLRPSIAPSRKTRGDRRQYLGLRLNGGCLLPAALRLVASVRCLAFVAAHRGGACEPHGCPRSRDEPRVAGRRNSCPAMHRGRAFLLRVPASDLPGPVFSRPAQVSLSIDIHNRHFTIVRPSCQRCQGGSRDRPLVLVNVPIISAIRRQRVGGVAVVGRTRAHGRRRVIRRCAAGGYGFARR